MYLMLKWSLKPYHKLGNQFESVYYFHFFMNQFGTACHSSLSLVCAQLQQQCDKMMVQVLLLYDQGR